MTPAEVIADWLRDRLDVMVENGPELRLRECLFCHRARTMKVNTEKRRFICHHGACGRVGGLVTLVQEIEGCTFDEAVAIVSSLVKGIARGHRAPEALADDLRRLQERDEEEASPTPLIHHDLPDEFVPCWDGARWRVPVYLKQERRVSRDSLRRWGVGYANEGPAAGRVIIPIHSAGAVSWVGRKVDPDEFGPKYLTPHSAGEPGADQLLFGYDDLPEDAPLVVGVEGTFDAIRLWSYGVPAVAYLKDRIGPGQVALLGKLRPRRLVLFPDGGDRRARDRALRDGASLASRFDEVAVALLDPPPGSAKADPDASPREVVLAAIEAAGRVSPTASLAFRRSNLRSPWSR